jgi:hypothetical protein
MIENILILTVETSNFSVKILHSKLGSIKPTIGRLGPTHNLVVLLVYDRISPN